jgi:hypothetical protein
MPPHIHFSPDRLQRPRKGIDAQVLIDGFSPGAPKDSFPLGMEYRLVADYLLECDRGFKGTMLVKPVSGFVLWSEPETVPQYRLAFGLGLLLDALEYSGRMGIKILFADKSAARLIQPAEPVSCIRFLEILEGVDDLEVRFRYKDQKSNSLIKGNFQI